MKIIKILFSILFLLIIVCVLAIGSLMILVDADKLKPVIIDEVKKETGYDLSIDGRLSWSFYPRIGVKVNHMALSLRDNQQPFIDAEDVSIAADVMQLLKEKEILDGDVLIANVKMNNVSAKNVSAKLNWKNNILTINPIKASLYEGTLEGEVTGSHFAEIPHWEWNVLCSGVQVKPLLEDANGVDSKIKITGIGSLKVQGSTQGKNQEQILKGLNGANEFSLNDGTIDGIDLNYFLQTANMLLNKESKEQPVNTKRTAFNSLTGSAVIKNGLVETNNTVLKAPAFTTKAQGSLNLISSDLDFKLQIKPQWEDAKIHWEIPVELTGDLQHPDVRLDTTEIQKIVTETQIDHLKEKAVKQIQKHVHGKAGEFLQNLLGS